jgi:hypothetical protein
MNCDSVLSKDGNKYIEWLIKRRRCMLVADEDFMANWSARTQRVLAYSRRPNAIIKAITTGTPVDEGPLEMFYPAKFLKEGLLGYADKVPFIARYCEFEVEEVEEILPNGMVIKRQLPAGKRFNKFKKMNGSSDPYDRYPVFKSYRNLDELREKIFGFAMRVRREDISNAPPKTYVSQYFDLSSEQQRVYDQLRDEYAVDLGSRKVTEREVLQRMTRLQMVARGYWPPERQGVPCAACHGLGISLNTVEEDCPVCDGLCINVVTTPLERIDSTSTPALNALVEALRQVPQPFVIWCRFRQDVDDVVRHLRGLGYTVFEHHGGVPDAQAEANYQLFKSGGGDGMVGTVGGGLGRGKDLSRATLTVYYSNDWSSRLRRQTEDRTEKIDRVISTTVVDLLAVGTRDEEVVAALRAKRELAARVLGDPVSWFGRRPTSCCADHDP